VDKSSVETVRRTISQLRPSVVAVELDENRLWALKDPDRGKLDSPFRSGLLPWLLALLERSVGSLTEVFPGTEMLEAVEEGQTIGARVVMIDKPIDEILKRLREIPLTERARIGIDTLAALVRIGARRTIIVGDKDLHKLMSEFDSKYPTLSRILVKERDEYMAKELYEILASTSGQVVAVVGLGHVRGIMQNLAQKEAASSRENVELRYEWTLLTFP